MTAAPDIHALDAAALTALRCEVGSVSATEWKRPTPCVGWNVTDLVEHMTTEHEAILAPFLGPVEAQTDLSAAFAASADRWIAAFGSEKGSPPTILVPKFGVALPTNAVLHVHFMDMIVHRWDLARARATPFSVPDTWLGIALMTARSISPESPLRDPLGPSYAAALPSTADAPQLDQLLAALGRQPTPD
jgi:uncharacterized protein (TIGR03086 family)